ncbi:hypothetical protein ADZ36_08030 [Streptomyces fradiae]|uniref:Uncharacterized protein n=1 Tax=Streptomyces fradiae TaxID=1906 RepID=A0ACC4WEN1_STRFR|nr:hypothetical protein ADZ36_08030 [Streptomyces fradiae]
MVRVAPVGQQADRHALAGERSLVARAGAPLMVTVAVVVAPALHARLQQREERAPHGVCAAHVAPFGIGRTAPSGDGCRPRFLIPATPVRRFRAIREFGHSGAGDFPSPRSCATQSFFPHRKQVVLVRHRPDSRPSRENKPLGVFST